MRKILHSDADCFYAAVEIRERPELAGRPVAVGGPVDGRGVISTCNYEARRFGVHSAMASAQALRLCPHLELLPGRMALYRQVSTQIFDIYREFSEIIEPLSLDEAFVDVSTSPHCQGSATHMARAIRAQVQRETGITVSVGVAPNKFLAKVASDWNKPDGLFVIPPAAVDGFVQELPVTRLHGVGQRTAEKLHAWGLYTCGDLRAWSLPALIERFGKLGRYLYDLAYGRDERPVRVERLRKSVSTEQTYSQDLPDLASCQQALPDLLDDLTRRFSKLSGYRIQGALVKIKFSDFVQTTVEHAGSQPDAATFARLLDEGWARASKPVRLLGVGYRLRHAQDPQAPVQLSFWGQPPVTSAPGLQEGPG